MTTNAQRKSSMAHVNGVALHSADDELSQDELRQRVCTELLRQTAQSAGLLDASDLATTDGVISEAAANAIDALLEQNLNLPEPSEEACRRYHAAHQNAYRTGERVRVTTRRLGRFGPQGVMFRLRISDPVIRALIAMDVKVRPLRK